MSHRPFRFSHKSRWTSGSLLVAAGLSVFGFSKTAEACGGCFVETRDNTIVSAHQMAFSVSATETTLWDQIQYDGDPEAFSWVLPIKGTVEVGLSSDALFEAMQNLTTVQVQAPFTGCPPDPCAEGDSAGAPTAGGEGPNGNVEVLAEQTVGPFETVQLSATDPDALLNWLETNQFEIPPDIQPVITAYVNEGFNFLAMRLQPGAGIDAMQPVRVTSQGAGVTLPLRMVAAGTGPTTAIRLWVVAEGRYQPTNFPSLVVDPDDVVWDAEANASNYSELRAALLDSGAGNGWLTVASVDVSDQAIRGPLQQAIQTYPTSSGYGQNVNEALDTFEEDMDKLFGGLPSTVRLTRMDAELPRVALANDLVLGAGGDQAEVSNFFAPTTVINAPECPQYDNNCGGDDFIGGAGVFGNNSDSPLSDGGCAIGSSGGAPWGLALLGLASGLAIVRRRRS